jgi:ligand-binding sensor domain-containing protein
VRDGEERRQLHKEDGWAGDYARTFAERSNGDLLVTAFNGKLFEFSDGKIAELPSPPGEKGQGYLGGVDEEGRWWAIQNKFIGRLESGGRWVSMISPPEVPRNAVGCAPASDGGMWLVLGNELRKLRRGTEVARMILPERPGGVWSLSEDSHGSVWIATYEKGVCCVTTNGALTRWTAANGGSDRGRCVFEDHEKDLWVGTSGDGLMRFAHRRFQYFDLEGGRQRALGGVGVAGRRRGPMGWELWSRVIPLERGRRD